MEFAVKNPNSMTFLCRYFLLLNCVKAVVHKYSTYNDKICLRLMVFKGIFFNFFFNFDEKF